jgi:hypothetical protein
MRPLFSSMDIEGARILSRRLAEQAHWEQAIAVRTGAAPRTDPDAAELTELHDELRVYGVEVETTVIDGQAALVERRLCKRLVGGEWRPFVDERITLAG